MRFVLITFFILLFSCTKPQTILICGDHKCVNKAEAEQYFEENLSLEVQIITKDKSQQEVLNLLEDLIFDFKEQNNLKKIESLEKKLINNMDENSYSELIRLKNQINRD